jgi:hypothetical protein
VIARASPCDAASGPCPSTSVPTAPDTSPRGTPSPRSPTEQTPPKPTTAMQATDAKMGKARARVPAAGRHHPRARTRVPEGADGARPAPIRTAVSSRRVSAE